jgi:hypothetical protein
MRCDKLVVLSVALLSACTQQDDAKIAAARSYVREVTGDDLKGPGRLQVSANGVTTDGRIGKLRGTVQNKFDETVYGVRYIVTIYRAGNPPRVLDRWQHEVDTTLDPGQRAPMTLDIESMYLTGSGQFLLDARPVKLGSKEMPPPEGWR